MFDQYGTVVDMQGGLTAIATPFLQRKGWTGNPNSFVTWWRRTHFENSMIDALLHKEHTPYREIGHRAVSFVMDRAGISHTEDEVRYLVGEIEKLPPFPEVPAALARLQTRYKLVVLSNGDPDMLETAKQYHKVPFDQVISVAEANSFKPHVATYTKAAELAGVAMHEVLFVANHAFDCIGAKAAGMRTAFIDRRRRPFGQTPPPARPAGALDGGPGGCHGLTPLRWPGCGFSISAGSSPARSRPCSSATSAPTC